MAEDSSLFVMTQPTETVLFKDLVSPNLFEILKISA